MSEILHESGDILTYIGKNTYLCHQCNCVTDYPYGLAKSIFNKYPESNTYTNRAKPSKPGTIDVFNIDNAVNIVNMYAQYLPGKYEKKNTSEVRKMWFNQCLKNLVYFLKQVDSNTIIVFPKNIGCGLAGGNWKEYLALINGFNKSVNAKVIVVSLE